MIYVADGDRLILEHTEVPESLGGRGIGGTLVRAALERAANEGLTVVPWCPFARKWVRDHADELTASIDWQTKPAR